ncbi:MAG: hypothetical protein HKN22_01920, partial [Bacteroidia bacterium]|nr:hypothetical protein [Bacteroidia bacterium]
LHSSYIRELWGSKQAIEFRSGEESFTAQVIGVDDYGGLILKDHKDQIRTYMNKEVEFIF